MFGRSLQWNCRRDQRHRGTEWARPALIWVTASREQILQNSSASIPKTISISRQARLRAELGAERRCTDSALGSLAVHHPEARRAAAALRSAPRTGRRVQILGRDKGPSLDPLTNAWRSRWKITRSTTATSKERFPQGEYGGGTVQLWDRGYWRPMAQRPSGARRRRPEIRAARRCACTAAGCSCACAATASAASARTGC